MNLIRSFLKSRKLAKLFRAAKLSGDMFRPLSVNVYVPNSQRELTRLAYRQQWDRAFSSLSQKSGEDKARDLLRRPQRRSHRTRSRQCEGQREKPRLHARGTRWF